MKKLILGMTVWASMVLAQTPPPPPTLAPGESVRVIEVKLADPTAVWDALRKVFPNVSVNNRMIVVRGPSDVIGAIEEAVKKMDVAPPPPPEARTVPNVELTVYLLYGSAGEASGSIPADLEPTVRQLRTLFPYKNYRVMDAQAIRGRDGQSVETNSPLPGSGSAFSNVSIKYRPRVTPGQAPHSVRLEGFQFNVRMQVFADAAKTVSNTVMGGINTEVDVREGQRTVVGKSNIAGTDDAIILVVTPKVIE